MTQLLQPFGRDIWLADGPSVSVIGFRYPTRMAAIRLKDGALFIWSPTALSDALRAELNALGEVRFIIAPNSLHHLFIPEWRTAYPKALVFAAPGLRERRKDIVFDDDLGETPSPHWAGQIDQTLMRGNLITTETVFFHHASRTALFTDLLQNFDPGWFSGWRALVARLDLLTGAEPRTPRKFRAAFIDRKAARSARDRILSWPVEKVLMAHGRPVHENGGAYLKRAFSWLSG